LPEEYEKCLVGVTSILREAWNTATNTENEREKIQALSLAKDCYAMKLDLLTNASVVNDAIRFVTQRMGSNSSRRDDEESMELVHKHGNAGLDDELKKELEGEAITTNRVF
jgi:hypothetical protein